MFKFTRQILGLMILNFVVSSPLYAASKYTISFVPQHSPAHLLRIWGPVIKAIENKTGIKLKLKIDSTIPAFEQKLENQTYDFAYMNPYHYTVFHEKGYVAFAKAKDKKIKGIFVSQKGSSIRSLADLEGKTISFPSPNAFAATLLTEAELRKKGINYTANYVKSHDSVYANVQLGRHVAGGGIKRTFGVFQDEHKDSKLKVLWTSKGYTPHAFAYHSRVPVDIAKKISDALFNVELSVLKKAKIKNGFMPALDADWNDVRALKIK